MARRLKLTGEDSPAWATSDPSRHVRAYPAACATLHDPSPAALPNFCLRVGQGQGHSPDRYSGEVWYRVACPDAHRDRAPQWLFNEHDYRAQKPDLADEMLEIADVANGYDDFPRSGAQACRRAHPLFGPDVCQAEPESDAARVSLRAGPSHHFLIQIKNRTTRSTYVDAL